MKKCIIVSDSFKGTISSAEICNIGRTTIPKFFPDCEVHLIPVADGGEGTVECFISAIGAKAIVASVSGPWGEKVEAKYAVSGDTAIIEMAAAAGLPMVEGRLNPAQTTTYGVGELIRHAVSSGCRNILLGLGGSATNDCGCGCAAALGTSFYDEEGKNFIPTGATLGKIRRIDTSNSKEFLHDVKITVMCDVDNPFYGPNGAAYIFGPQKGADPEMVEHLDRQMRILSDVIERDFGINLQKVAGAGAAGGMGGGCVAFLNAKLESGINSILEMVDFDNLLHDTDLVITGEGRIDSQSVHGKVISGISKRTKKRNVPLIAIVGSIAEDAEDAYDAGVSAMFSIDRPARAFEDYKEQSAEFYRRTLEDILRLIKAVNG